MDNIQNRIRSAVETTKRVIPGYFEKTLQTRSSDPLGSCYELSPEDLEKALLATPWEPYEHLSVMPGCSAFRAPLPGLFGLVDLTKLHTHHPVTINLNPKGTGFIEAYVEGVARERVDFTVLILGDENGEEVVFTFHPGDPILPSRLEAPPGPWVPFQLYPSAALFFGLRYAKLMG